MMVGEEPSFGDLLRWYRVAANMTQCDLAGLAGVGLETIGALERGINVRPRKSTVERLSEALGLADAARAEFEAYARSRPQARQRLVVALEHANCSVCRFNCAGAPAPWGALLTTICRERR